MFDVENKNSLDDYANILRKIRHIKSKELDVDIVSYSLEVEQFVVDYLKGRLLFKISSSEVNKNIDYDMDFVLKNLGNEWKDEILYLQNRLKKELKKGTKSCFFVRLLKKVFWIILILFPIMFFIQLRFGVKADTSFDILTNQGLDNAARIHFKSTRYDYLRKKYDNIPPVIVSVVLWSLELSDEENKYYNQYIALNIEVADMLKRKGVVCCNFCSFDSEEIDEEKADKFIKFIDIPSTKIVEEAKSGSTPSDKVYYNFIVQSYKEKFPCIKAEFISLE